MPILPGHQERRVLKRFKLLCEWCSPRVFAVVFRTYWNGWVTTARMKELFKTTGQSQKKCILNCGWEEDSLDHYMLCNKYWQFVTTRRPKGLGIPLAMPRSRETVLLLSDCLADEDAVRLALGLYSWYRTLNFIRFSGCSGANVDIPKMLQMWAKRAADNSPAKALLRFP